MVWSSDSEMLPLRMMGTRNLFAYFFCFGMLLSSVAQEGLDRNEKDYIKTIQFSSLKQNDAFPIVALNEKILFITVKNDTEKKINKLRISVIKCFFILVVFNICFFYSNYTAFSFSNYITIFV